jgi:hypothetical protein
MFWVTAAGPRQHFLYFAPEGQGQGRFAGLLCSPRGVCGGITKRTWLRFFGEHGVGFGRGFEVFGFHGSGGAGGYLDGFAEVHDAEAVTGDSVGEELDVDLTFGLKDS